MDSNDTQSNFLNGKENIDERLVCSGCNKIHAGARLVKTEDGRILGNYSKEWALHCEARWVFKKKKTKNTRRQYLEQVREKRGEKGYEALYQEMTRVWTARNAKAQPKPE